MMLGDIDLTDVYGQTFDNGVTVLADNRSIRIWNNSEEDVGEMQGYVPVKMVARIIDECVFADMDLSLQEPAQNIHLSFVSDNAWAIHDELFPQDYRNIVVTDITFDAEGDFLQPFEFDATTHDYTLFYEGNAATWGDDAFDVLTIYDSGGMVVKNFYDLDGGTFRVAIAAVRADLAQYELYTININRIVSLDDAIVNQEVNDITISDRLYVTYADETTNTAIATDGNGNWVAVVPAGPIDFDKLADAPAIAALTAYGQLGVEVNKQLRLKAAVTPDYSVEKFNDFNHYDMADEFTPKGYEMAYVEGYVDEQGKFQGSMGGGDDQRYPLNLDLSHCYSEEEAQNLAGHRMQLFGIFEGEDEMSFEDFNNLTFVVLDAVDLGYYLIGEFNEWNEFDMVPFTFEGDDKATLSMPLVGEFLVKDGQGNWLGGPTSADRYTLTADSPSSNLVAEGKKNFCLEIPSTYTLTIDNGILTASGFPTEGYYLCGDFNGWKAEAMAKNDDGTYTIQATLGEHDKFKFRDCNGNWYGGDTQGNGDTYEIHSDWCTDIDLTLGDAGSNFIINTAGNYTFILADDGQHLKLTVKGFAVPPVEVAYIDENREEQTAMAIALTGSETALGAEGEETWYVADGTLNYTQTLTLSGDVHLILASGAVMSIGTEAEPVGGYGIDGNAAECALTVYGQTLDDDTAGHLNVNSGDDCMLLWGDYAQHGGNVALNSTDGAGLWLDYNVTLTGGTLYITAYAKGIANGGNIDILGGKFSATGSVYSDIYSNRGTFTFGWKTADDVITFGRLDRGSTDCAIKFVEGQAFTDGENIYDSTTPQDVLWALTNVTLRPAPTFAIHLPSEFEHGTVECDKTTAAEGQTVTLTVTPDDGYELDGLTVTTVDGEPSGAPRRAPLRANVDVTPGENGTYTFAMPAAPVAVTATFKEATITAVEDINVATAKRGQRYNLMGQPVAGDYKGIVVEDGKLMVR